VIAVALVAGCATGNPALRQEALSATYNTEFATVWNALQASVREDFPSGIKTEDATVGYIETKWESVELVLDSTDGDSDAVQNKRAGGVGARNLFRVMARIEPGGPPWRVVVDGEAALYRPNHSMLQPYKHGAIDEPQWVQGRIDRVRVRMHNALKQYAVVAPAKDTPK
jgi:hypothetical protein